MIYFKFLRPEDNSFISKKSRTPFHLILIPPVNDPEEKYCFAEIPEHLFEQFSEEFGEGEILKDREEFPDNFPDIAKGRHNKFRLVQPRTDAPKWK